MAEIAALLTDEILPERPLRQWVLSLPMALRFLLATRPGRMLERRGLIERDAENAWLSGEPGEAGALDDLIGRSITYRIAVGPRAGQKVFTLISSPESAPSSNACAAAADAPDEVSRSVRDRDRHLRPLAGKAAGDRESRGAGGDRADPGASGSGCWRAGTGTCAHCGAGAAAAGQACAAEAAAGRGQSRSISDGPGKTGGFGCAAGRIGPGRGRIGPLKALSALI